MLLRKLAAAIAVLALSALATGGLAAGEPYRDAHLPAETRVRDLLDRMTLEEKIAQLTQKGADKLRMNGEVADPDSLQELFGEHSVGVGCVKFGEDLFESALRLSACQRYLRARTRLGIPALTINEGLHGVLAKGATIYPQFLALGCTWNPALAHEMGAQIAAEATAGGINHLLTPMIEVIRDPRWGRVEECLGESPYLVSRLTVAYTLGIQGDLRGGRPLAPDKALAMLKTFAGYSVPDNGINIAPAMIGERQLRSVFFPPVEANIRETGVLSVMPAYNEIDGIPAHANRWLLEDVLDGWQHVAGFRGDDGEGKVFLHLNLCVTTLLAGPAWVQE